MVPIDRHWILTPNLGGCPDYYLGNDSNSNMSVVNRGICGTRLHQFGSFLSGEMQKLCLVIGPR